MVSNKSHSASSAVIVRSPYLLQFRNPDFLWATVDIAIWSDIEQGLAITAGSLATLRPLFRAFAERVGLTHSGAPQQASGQDTRDWYRTPSSKPKKSGPFSLGNITRSDKPRADSESEELALGNLPPIQLRDPESDDEKPQVKDKSFTTWRIQVGHSEENLHKTDVHGVVGQETMFMEGRR